MKEFKFICLCIFLSLTFTMIPIKGFAATLIIPDTYPAIQTAINAAVNGDEIFVRNGTYSEDINFYGKAITIRSENGALYTTIDGTYIGNPIVTFDSKEGGDSVLDGFTIQNNYGSIGGIYCFSHSSPTIKNCIITGNTATNGAGIYCAQSSSPFITECVIKNNTATNDGGGIYCTQLSSPSIIKCTILNNTAPNYGAGIYCRYSSSPMIINSTIADNSTTSLNSTGGGIYISSFSSPKIINCTVANNATHSSGAGILVAMSSSPCVVNSIFWGNKANGLSSEISINFSSTIDVTFSNVEGGWPGAANINIDPLFVDYSNGDYHLEGNSPCVDKGTSNPITCPMLPTDDIDGDLRPHDGNNSGVAQYDMGSDESMESVNPAPVLAVEIIVNKTSFVTGDDVVIGVRTTNDTTPDEVIESVWVKYPNGDLLPLSLEKVDIPANDDTTTTVLEYTLDGSEQAGDYEFGVRIGDSVTLESIDMDVKILNFMPLP